VFCVIPFEPIEVQTCSATQNDHPNLSFVKYIYADGGKLARNGQKTAILVVVGKNYLDFSWRVVDE
jgi:hypothetical protein